MVCSFLPRLHIGLLLNQADWPTRRSKCYYRATDLTFSDTGTDSKETDVAETFFLDRMYTQILEQSTQQLTGTASQRRALNFLREVLGAIAALKETLPTVALAQILFVRKERIYQQLSQLHSLVRVPTEPSGFIRMLHTSFRDFLFDRRRCSNPNFFLTRQEQHQRLLERCIKVMASGLRRNICNLQHPGVLLSEMDQETISQNIPLQLQYACRYWVDHFLEAEADVKDIDSFVYNHLLHWIEVLGLIGRVSEGIRMLIELNNAIPEKEPSLQTPCGDDPPGAEGEVTL